MTERYSLEDMLDREKFHKIMQDNLNDYHKWEKVASNISYFRYTKERIEKENENVVLVKKYLCNQTSLDEFVKKYDQIDVKKSICILLDLLGKFEVKWEYKSGGKYYYDIDTDSHQYQDDGSPLMFIVKVTWAQLFGKTVIVTLNVPVNHWNGGGGGGIWDMYYAYELESCDMNVMINETEVNLTYLDHKCFNEYPEFVNDKNKFAYDFFEYIKVQLYEFASNEIPK